MRLLSQEHKHQTLVQLRSGVPTRKVAALVGMSQSSVVNMRKDVGGEMERQRGRASKASCGPRQEALCHSHYWRSTWKCICDNKTSLIWNKQIVVWHHCEACFERGWIGCTNVAHGSVKSAQNTMDTRGTPEWHPRFVAPLVRGPKWS